MNTKHINGKHVRENSQEMPLHLTLKSRATAAVTAGCLALSLCPALAFAAPGAMESPQQSFGVPHEQQMSQGWQASDDGQATDGQQSQQAPDNGRQAPSDNSGSGNNGAPEDNGQPPANGAPADNGELPANGQEDAGAPPSQPSDQQGSTQNQVPADNQQAPSGDKGTSEVQQPPANGQFGQPANGQQGPRADRPAGDSAVDDQVRTVLSDEYGVEVRSIEKGSDAQKPASATDGIPEIPEGQPNVQQVIDTTRDIVREYGAEALEKADFSDQTFLTKLAVFANTAVEQRMELFQKTLKPSDGAQTDASSPDKNAAPGADSSNANAGAPNASTNTSPDATQGNAAQQPAKNPVDENVSATVIDQVVGFLASLFGFSSQQSA